MEIVGFVGFAGVVVFGLLYIVFFFKGASLKIPVIGMAVFVLVLAAAVLLPLMGITVPGTSTADEPTQSGPAGGGLSEPTPTPALTSEPALTSASVLEPTPTPAPEEPAPTLTPAPGATHTPAPTLTPAPGATHTPAPTPTPPAPAEEFKRILTGSWSNAYRGNDMLYTTDFDFSAGGELHIGTGAYSNINSFYMEGEEYDEYGWFWAPMGHPSFYGNYSLTASGDNRFKLVTVGAWDYASDALEQHTYELTYVNDNTIRIDGDTFVRGSNYTLVEYARIFGFDIEY